MAKRRKRMAGRREKGRGWQGEGREEENGRGKRERKKMAGRRERGRGWQGEGREKEAKKRGLRKWTINK